MKKRGIGDKLNLKKKTPGLVWVHPSRPGHGSTTGSTGFCRVIAPDGFLTNPNRSSNRVLGQPTRPGLITVVIIAGFHSSVIKF
jgi:hypothetical protein